MSDPAFRSSIREASAIALSYGWRVAAFDSIDSTNAEAQRAAESGAEPGLVVWGREQTAGRGRRGRRWESSPGNLFMSIYLDVSFASQSDIPQLSFVAALAICDLVEELAPQMTDKLSLKWPNDVLADGAKLAGILLEGAGPGHVVVGMGVNLKRPNVRPAYPVTSIQHYKRTVLPEEALGPAVRCFHDRTARWAAGGFGPIREAWLEKAEGLDRVMTVVQGETEITGVFIELDDAGALVLQDEDGQKHTILAGDVVFGDVHTKSAD